MLGVCLSCIVLLVYAFIDLFLIRDPVHSYDSYVIYPDNVRNRVLVENYCDDKWCGVRISINYSDSHDAWVPVLVYDKAYYGFNEPEELWEQYIKPQCKWLNSNELEISITQVDQILFRADDIEGRRIVCHVWISACKEINNVKSNRYGNSGESWKYIGPDSQCEDLILHMIHARSDVRSGVNKGEVWKRLHDQGVTDQDIWRIGL
jgi:hypothetical protein